MTLLGAPQVGLSVRQCPLCGIPSAACARRPGHLYRVIDTEEVRMPQPERLKVYEVRPGFRQKLSERDAQRMGLITVEAEATPKPSPKKPAGVMAAPKTKRATKKK